MNILYVDSQTEIRAQRVSPFLLKGMEVHEADSLEAGEALLRELSELDVLVVEAIFDDGQLGKTLAESARARFPELRVVYTSRYLLEGYESHYQGVHVIFEPVRESLLISEVLGFCPVEYPFPEASDEAVVADVVVEEEPKVQRALLAEDDFYEAPQILTPGTVLENYRIEERIYSEEKTETYKAIQLGIGREVALVLMRPERLFDVGALADFKERQRVKASISHPKVAPLYEAVQKDRYYFYTRELPHGKSLQQLQLEQKRFSEKALADVVFHVAEAMEVGVSKGYDYRMPSVRDIFVDEEGIASIVNVFRPVSGLPRKHTTDTRRFLSMLRLFAEGPRARHLLEDLLQEKYTWVSLKERGEELQEEFRERSLLRRADSHEKRDIEAAQSGQISWKVYAFIGVITAMLVAAILLRSKMENPPEARPIVARQVEIPAGEFLYGRNERKKLPAFWIDAYEVTIAQYAEFLKYLEANPMAQQDFDHPEQPFTKHTHRPKGWDAIYKAAQTGGTFNEQPLNLNSPITLVDWWDAYAYAQWKGHRLPSDLEWEKAARGPNGLIYPWGKHKAKDLANLGVDYAEHGEGGKLDGFNFSAPVTATNTDMSPYGVHGMGGNVSEWTATWDMHPDFPDVEVPVVKGGNFTTRLSENLLRGRTFSDSADEVTRLRGFRTVSDKAPVQPSKAAPKKK